MRAKRELPRCRYPTEFEPQTSTWPNALRFPHNPGIHPPIPPEIEPDLNTDSACLRMTGWGLLNVLAFATGDTQWWIR